MNPQTFSIEAEQSFLGALMCDGADAMSRVECEVTPAHFYRQDHGRIYAAARKLVDAGRSADSIAVSDALEDAGELQSVGGLGYVSSLQASSYSSAGIRRHAEIIVERAAIRSLLAVSGQIADLVAEHGQSTQEKIDAAQKLVMGLSERATLGASEPKTVAELMPGYLDAVEERWEKKGGGMDTGFPDFDKRLNGGFAEGNFVVLAGRPGMGKTALGIQIAYHFARQGRGALVCSQEMQSIQLMDRVAAFVGRVNLGRVIKGDMSDDESGRFHEAVSSIFNIPLSLDDQGSLKMDDVRRKARKVKGKHGLSVLVIDYLQLMVGDGENRTRELTQITGALKALAKELRICVIALSQLNRAVEQRQNRRPIMADLRESGSIEQDADVIIAPYRDEYYNEDSPHKGLAELLILKNRQGAPGGFVPLAYQGEYTRFDSMYGAWPDGDGRAEGKRTRRGFDG
ncbi:MAG TPA: replicative DNA helicase [Verrucomicrobiota bacterium]|nr:replicative DNA helicase [Verrucomicrobiota bacterium]